MRRKCSAGRIRRIRPQHGRSKSPTPKSLAGPVGFILILHELLLEGPRKYTAWDLTQDSVKVGFADQCDIILPQITIMQGFLNLAAFFTLTFNRNSRNWWVQFPNDQCPRDNNCQDPDKKIHYREVPTGGHPFTICMGCGRPCRCCTNLEHPELRFTIEKDIGEELASKIPDSVWSEPPEEWFDDMNGHPAIDLLATWIPANPRKVNYMINKYKMTEFPEKIGKWTAWRLLHMLDYHELKYINVPPQPPQFTAELDLFHRLLETKPIKNLYSKRPHELSRYYIRVEELLELHWEITEQNQNIGWDLTRLNLDTAREAPTKVDCSWRSANDVLPQTVEASDMRILFGGMAGLTHLYMTLPLARDAWSEGNGLLYILENLTVCHLTFCVNGTEHPDLHYFSSAEELSFTTREDNEDSFWDWLFYSQARLLNVRTLKLGTRKCTYSTMGGKTNWRGIGRTFPRATNLSLKFEETVDDVEEYEKMTDNINDTWPHTRLRIYDPEWP